MTFAKGDRVEICSTRHGPSLYNGEFGTVTGILSAHDLSELKRGRRELTNAKQAFLVALDSSPAGKRYEKLRPVDWFGLPCTDMDVKPLQEEEQ